MTLKVKIRVFAAYGFVLMVLFSCVKRDLIGPDVPVTITLVTDWNKRSEGIEVPASYTADLGEYSSTLYGERNKYPHSVLPGIYRLSIYNTAEKIEINNYQATLQENNGMVDAIPGWLFSWSGEVAVTDDLSQEITAHMIQQVGQLTLHLVVKEGDPEKIKSVDAVLSGIASNLDIKKNEVTGKGTNIQPLFLRKANKLSSVVRLLGIVSGEEKILALNITLADGKIITVESNLSKPLNEFNKDKYIPKSWEGELRIIEDPVEAGFKAVISNWKEIDGGSIVVD